MFEISYFLIKSIKFEKDTGFNNPISNMFYFSPESISESQEEKKDSEVDIRQSFFIEKLLNVWSFFLEHVPEAPLVQKIEFFGLMAPFPVNFFV